MSFKIHILDCTKFDRLRLESMPFLGNPVTPFNEINMSLCPMLAATVGYLHKQKPDTAQPKLSSKV